MFKQWRTPAGKTSSFFEKSLQAPHLLIAGTTGSGKSELIRKLIETALYRAPSAISGCAMFILIDLKRVELQEFKDLPHCLRYADTADKAVEALRIALKQTESRFSAMQRKKQTLYDGADLYIIIDEFADLMTTRKKEVVPLIQRIAQIGRAAKVHIILATQTPIAKILPTEIKCNFDYRFGLRTRSAQDSRNILGVNGCENLPKYGEFYYYSPNGLDLYTFKKISNIEIIRLCRHWLEQMTLFDKFNHWWNNKI